MNGTIGERIREIERDATKSQKILIEYLAGTNYKDIIYLSITELAEATGVAEATILRFCRHLGFNGYQDFKLRMAQEVSGSARNGEDTNYIQLIANNYLNAIDKSREMVSLESVARAVDLLLSAKTVSAFGIGNSRIPAAEFHTRLLKMGLYSQCEQDTHLQNMLVSSMGEGDCLILFSVSGGTKDVIDVAEIAKLNGVRVIVVTGHDRSPLTKYADVILTSLQTESPADAGSMVTKVTQLFFVDVLCTGIFLRDRERFSRRIDKSNVSVVGKLV